MNALVVLPRSPAANASGSPVGSWWVGYPLGSDDNADTSKPYVSIRCPTCGQSATLRHPNGGHTIAADGTVTPSVVCPYPPCTWHEWVRLGDWVGP